MSHDILERPMMCVCASSVQNKTHSLPLTTAPTKQTEKGFKAHFDIQRCQHSTCESAGKFVFTRFRCVSFHTTGQMDDDASESGSCLIQGGWGAGRRGTIQATPPTPRLPLFHPLTPLSLTSPHSSSLQGLECFEQPSWIEMRRGERKRCNLTQWRPGCEHERPIKMQ